MKLKLLDKKRIIGAAQGALWAGGGMAATAYGGHFLRSKVSAIGNFANTPMKRALVDATTGLAIAATRGGLPDAVPRCLYTIYLATC